MKRIKTLVLTLCAVLAVCLSAHAADVNKAAAGGSAPAGYPAAGTPGFFIDLGTYAAMGSSTITNGSTSTNVNSVGGALELGVGYQYKIPGDWAATIFSVNYTNLGGSTACGITGCGVTGPWGFGLEQDFGFNWPLGINWLQGLSGLIGTNPNNLLPVDAKVVSSVPYLGLKADFDNVQANLGTISNTIWRVSPEVKVGLINYLQNGSAAPTTALKTWAGCEFNDASMTLGPKGSAKPANLWKAGIDLSF